jgi:hypothetical protein
LAAATSTPYVHSRSWASQNSTRRRAVPAECRSPRSAVETRTYRAALIVTTECCVSCGPDGRPRLEIVPLNRCSHVRTRHASALAPAEPTGRPQAEGFVRSPPNCGGKGAERRAETPISLGNAKARHLMSVSRNTVERLQPSAVWLDRRCRSAQCPRRA